MITTTRIHELIAAEIGVTVAEAATRFDAEVANVAPVRRAWSAEIAAARIAGRRTTKALRAAYRAWVKESERLHATYGTLNAERMLFAASDLAAQ